MSRPLRSNPKTKHQAIRLRKDLTPAERKLWSRIRNNQLEVNFRRQHAIGNYIPDFCSPKAKLGIKLDGLQAKVNALRERWLSSLDSSSLRAGLGRVRGVMPFAGSVA